MNQVFTYQTHSQSLHEGFFLFLFQSLSLSLSSLSLVILQGRLKDAGLSFDRQNYIIRYCTTAKFRNGVTTAWKVVTSLNAHLVCSRPPPLPTWCSNHSRNFNFSDRREFQFRVFEFLEKRPTAFRPRKYDFPSLYFLFSSYFILFIFF